MADAIDTARLRELLGKATPGPWNVERRDAEDGSINYEIWNLSPGCYERVLTIYEAYDSKRTRQDAALIAALRNAAPALLDMLDAQAARIAALREALREVDKHIWSDPGEADAIISRVLEADHG